MTILKNIGISLGFIIGSLLGITVFITLLHYLNWIGPKTLSILKILTPLISSFVGGFVMGKRSLKNGWLEGLKLSGIFLVLLILFEYLGLHIHFSIKTLLFYLLILISCVFGSMLGVNKNQPQKK